MHRPRARRRPAQGRARGPRSGGGAGRGDQRAGFEGTTTINRSDFGLTWNAALETGGVLVSEKVTLEIEVSAIKSA